MRGLLAGTALAVDRGGRYRVGEACAEHGATGDIEALLATLAHACPVHVVDERGVEALPVDQGAQRAGQQIGGMDAGCLAARLAVAGRVRTRSMMTLVMWRLPGEERTLYDS
jgi:hypothetical protein